MRAPSKRLPVMQNDTETHQSPEDRKHPGGTQDQKAAQRLGVVGLHHLDDAQQGLHARPPQVAHVQPFQIHQAGPRTAGEMSSVQYTAHSANRGPERLAFLFDVIYGHLIPFPKIHKVLKITV